MDYPAAFSLAGLRTKRAVRLSDIDDVRAWFQDRIAERVVRAGAATTYRDPLVGFARAGDPRFEALRRRVPGHLAPHDLLPRARTVCAFFLPFHPQVVRANASGSAASEVWARAYVETNALLADVCASLVDSLREMGVGAAWEPPTHNFDPVRLVSAWSHKSAAYIAGLGRFGHHHMLITKAGCAGRLGSLALDADLEPTRPARGSYCAFDRGCRACVRRCPVGALTEEGLDRQRCYAQCLANDARFSKWLADVCGKCVIGPCAYRPARDQGAKEGT